MIDNPLLPVEKVRVMQAIEAALRAERPDLFESPESGASALANIETDLDALVEIARRSTADRIEPYLAQVIDDVCSKCPREEPSGFCPARYTQQCVHFRHAATIFTAIEQSLTRMADPAYCAVHTLPKDIVQRT